MSWPHQVLRALVAAILAASCTSESSGPPPNLTDAPPTAAIPSIGPSDAPTGPTPVPGAQAIGSSWERAPRIRGGRIADIARGPDGWLAAGSATCREQGCGRRLAATWFSTDGFTWTGGPIVPPGRESAIHTVATDGVRWFAVGYGYAGRAQGFRRDALIWRSPNGREWTQVGTLELDPPAKGLGPIGELVAGPGGLILTYFDGLDPEQFNVYWSRNGEAWEPIDKATFGLPDDGSVAFWAATVVDGRFVLVGACGDCGSVWSSRNGRDWRLDATLGESFRGSAVGSDERRVVVVDEHCPDACDGLGIWVSGNGRTRWTRSPQRFPVNEAYLTFAAGKFILSASIEDNDDPGQGVHIYTSSDGLRWTEFVEPAFRTGECYTSGLEGGVDRVVFLGSNECEGLWVSLAPDAR